MRRALLIGNGTFEDERITPLKSPVSDLTELGHLLARPEVGGYDVQIHFDSTSGALRRAVQMFFDKAAPSDFLFVMVSGHGIKDSDGKLHFASRDSDFDAINATSLEARFLHERMDRSAAAQKVLFLDTCYSGAFAKDYISKGVPQRVTRDEFGDDQSRGKVVITASTAIQIALESTVGASSKSRFTRHLIEGIATGKADSGGQGKVTVDDLYDYICEALHAERANTPTAPQQNPQRWYFGLQGSVWLARNPAPKPLVFSDDLLARLASDQAHLRALAVDDLAHLVRNGDVLGPLAWVKLAELSDDDSNLVGASADRAMKRLAAFRQEPVVLSPETPSPAIPLNEASAPEDVVDTLMDVGIEEWPQEKTAQGGDEAETSDWDLEPDEDLPARSWYTPAILVSTRTVIGGLLASGIVMLFWVALTRSGGEEPTVAETAMEAQAIDTKIDAAATDTAEFAISYPYGQRPAAEASNAAQPSPTQFLNADRAETFDCRKAVMPLDWAICADPQALNSNTDMVTVWHAVRNSLPASERKAYVDRHMKWILATQAVCGLPVKGRPSDAVLKGAAACVRKAYAERILEIRRERDMQRM